MHFKVSLGEGEMTQYSKQMYGTHNVDKVEANFCWVTWVLQIKKTYISIYDVPEANEKFCDVK